MKRRQLQSDGWGIGCDGQADFDPEDGSPVAYDDPLDDKKKRRNARQGTKAGPYALIALAAIITIVIIFMRMRSGSPTDTSDTKTTTTISTSRATTSKTTPAPTTSQEAETVAATPAPTPPPQSPASDRPSSNEEKSDAKSLPQVEESSTSKEPEDKKNSDESATRMETQATTSQDQQLAMNYTNLPNATPQLELAQEGLHIILKALLEGKCDHFVFGVLSASGTYNIKVSYLALDGKAAEDLRKFCDLSSTMLQTYALRYTFPDFDREEEVHIVDAFVQDAKVENDPMRKESWAIRLKRKDKAVIELRIYSQTSTEMLPPSARGVLDANLQRIQSQSCKDLNSLLPGTWLVAGVPSVIAGEQNSVSEKSQQEVLSQCQIECDRASKVVRFQHSRGSTIFSSKEGLEVVLVFQKEVLLKDSKMILSAPEAVVVELDQQVELKVRKLHFFYVEAVTVTSEWSWKFGKKASSLAASEASAAQASS